MNRFYKLLICSFLLSSAHAQNTYTPPAHHDPQRLEKMKAALPLIDQLFRAYAGQAHIPGMVWGLMVDGQLIHSGTYGYTDLQNKTPVTTASVFRIASMSKSFTAMAIVKLRDENKLRLDDAVVKYIPEFKKSSYISTDSRAVTIRDLLTHAAGFPEDNPWGDRQLADSDEDLENLLRSGLTFSTSPGTTYEYSNLGFALLGKIISVVTGTPYGTYIEEKILKPLQMNHTYWSYEKVPHNQLARGYRWINNQWREEALLSHGAWGAMGGMLTSLNDFAKYVSLHQSAWPPNHAADEGPVTRSTIREMHHPWNFAGLNPTFKYPTGRICPVAAAYGYGLGWMKDCENRVMIGHSGGLPGFGSHWRFLPDYGIAVISFANRTYAGTGSVNTQVLDTLIRVAALKPALVIPSPVWKERTNQLASLLPYWSGAESTGIFAENFFADYVLDSLRKESIAVFEKIGKPYSIGEMKPLNQLRGSFTMTGEKGSAEVWFTLTPENPALIQEYRIRFVPK